MSVVAIDLLQQDPHASTGKFVLIEQKLDSGSKLALVRSSMKIYEFHAQIVAAYLEPLGIHVRLNSDRSDLGAALDPAVQLHGGGYWEQQVPDHVSFWGKSAAFGPFDAALLQREGLKADYSWDLRRG